MFRIILSLLCLSFLFPASAGWGQQVNEELAAKPATAEAGPDTADQDQDNAACLPGLAYYDGRGVPQNHEEAASWFRMAADEGHAQALQALDSALEEDTSSGTVNVEAKQLQGIVAACSSELVLSYSRTLLDSDGDVSKAQSAALNNDCSDLSLKLEEGYSVVHKNGVITATAPNGQTATGTWEAP